MPLQGRTQNYHIYIFLKDEQKKVNSFLRMEYSILIPILLKGILV